MSSAFYRSAEWRRLRAECLRRQPVCVTPGCGKPATVADHIVPRSKGGADSLANLRGVCAACHNSRTARGNGALRVRGCDASGWPLDPGHAWRR